MTLYYNSWFQPKGFGFKVVVKNDFIDFEKSLVEPEHPLLIDTVFYNISKYLCYNDLISSKKLCKTWCIMINFILKERQSLYICKNYQNLNPSLTKILGISKITISQANFDQTPELITLLDHPKTQHLSNLIIENSTMSTETFYNLLQKHGHKLANLTVGILNNIAEPIDESTSRFYPFPIPKAANMYYNNNYHNSFGAEEDNNSLVYPNLKSLSLTLYGNAICNFHGICTSLPNLVELKLYGNIIPFDEIFGRSSNNNYLKLQCLRKLNIELADSGTQWNELITYLKDIQLKLVDLELYNVYKEVNMDIIKMFLQTQENTLKHLIIVPGDLDYTINEEIETKELEIPKLTELEELTINGIYIANIVKTLKLLPNIEELNLNVHSRQQWTKIISADDIDINNPILSLKRLCLTDETGSIEDGLSEIGINEFKALCKLFPALEELKIDYCTDELLPIIFKELNGLTDLTIHSKLGQITDSGFLGITLEDCKRLQEGDLSVLELIHNNNTSSTSIRNMKKLEKLAIDNVDQILFTNLTLLHGIIDLPNLELLFMVGIQGNPELRNAFKNKGYEYTSEQRNGFGFGNNPVVHTITCSNLTRYY